MPSTSGCWTLRCAARSNAILSSPISTWHTSSFSPPWTITAHWGLEIKPPDTVRYFVRVRPDVLARHAEAFRNRTDTDFKTEADAEDDFVYQNSFNLNAHFYGDRPDKRAYVVSHGRNMMILKAVGYAEDIARYYCLEDVAANVWIGHQRYPTRGECGTQAGRIRSVGWTKPWCTTGTLPTLWGRPSSSSSVATSPCS